MPSRPNSRYQRSSFQGLSIIEGERNFAYGDFDNNRPPASKARESVNRDFQLYKDRKERRRRSSSLAQSHQIREIIAKTVEDLSRKGNIKEDAKITSAEDRLKEVLTEAKESGYSAERIFSIIGRSKADELTKPGHENLDEFVPKQSFVAGLKKLGRYNWRDDELDLITNKFDVSGDGFISLKEFQHYCYHEISSVSWKAERQRLENATDSEKITGDVSDRSSEGRFDLKEIIFSCGPEVYKTSKLFWKIELSVDIVLRYCNDLDVITMQINNVSSKEDYKTLYIRKKDCVIDQEALEEAAALAIQTSDEKTEEGQDLIRKSIHWEFYSNYLVARLQMVKKFYKGSECYLPRLIKLHGDEFTSLEIENQLI